MSVDLGFNVSAPAGCSEEFRRRLQVKAAFFNVLGYVPHEYQWLLIHSRPERYNIECWPRQHGKSTAIAYEDIFDCADTPGGLFWLVAPTYDLCEPIFNEILKIATQRCKFPEFSVTRKSFRDMYIEFSNGSRYDCKSAENVTSLQGRALDGLTLEEWGSVADPTVYEQYLRPTIAAKRARMKALSTPKGFNGFFDMFQRGQDPMERDWFSGRAPLGCSPYVTHEEIEEARKSLPERIFRQEWMAEFVSDAGAVFRGVKDCVIRGHDGNQSPEDGHFYAAGIDLAKHEDYSVVTVVDRVRKRQVYFDRFNEVDWHRQLPMFAHVAAKYGDCPVLMDSTGLGDPIYEFCRELGMRVYPYNFSGNRKEDLINNLALAIERRELSLMDIPEQTNELIGYEYSRTKMGRLSMSAPGRQHDDIVISLALAWWQASQGTGQVKTLAKGWRM